jgi:hypothetical protein
LEYSGKFEGVGDKSSRDRRILIPPFWEEVCPAELDLSTLIRGRKGFPVPVIVRPPLSRTEKQMIHHTFSWTCNSLKTVATRFFNIAVHPLSNAKYDGKSSVEVTYAIIFHLWFEDGF